MKEMQQLFRSMSDGLKTMADGLESIAEQLYRLAEVKSSAEPVSEAERPKTIKKGAQRQKTAAESSDYGTGTAPEVVFEAVKKADNGIDNRTIVERTGFDKKKVANALYRLKKDGKIKAVSRGIYAA